MKYLITIIAFFAIAGLAVHSAEAKLPPKIQQALLASYPPAEEHHGIESAHEAPDPAKLHGFVVLEKGGVPAERARYLISWEEYDYRGAVVDVARGEALSTRRGKVYTYLQTGDVLAVAGLKDFNNTVYLKLITADVYVPETRKAEKHFSRVTVMLGFQFPKEIFKGDDGETVVTKISEWLKPFSNVDEAKAYAAALRNPAAAASADAEAEKAAKGKKGKKGKKEAAPAGANAAAPADAGATAVAVPNVDDKEIEGLEKKIEEARRQMEDAEKQMQEIKKSRQKGK